MTFIQRFIIKMFMPLLGTLREEVLAELKQGDTSIRRDVQAELQDVGRAIVEIRQSAPFTAQAPDDLSSLGERLAVVERILYDATEPQKPGNHIGPSHEFGNKIRL